MATVIINDKIKAGKLFLEFLKSQTLAKVIEKKYPNAKTRQAIKDAENNKIFKTENVEDLIKQLNS